jgi:hypothetical protein
MMKKQRRALRFRFLSLSCVVCLSLAARAGDDPPRDGGTPVDSISCEILEVMSGGCRFTVTCGAKQGVKPGAACSIVNAKGAVIDGCVLDGIYPNVTRIRPLGFCSSIPRQGTTVRIQLVRNAPDSGPTQPDSTTTH